jgi:hypothetical protein
MLRVCLFAVALFVLASCGGDPPSDITQAQAVAAAHRSAQAMSESPIMFVSAETGELAGFAPGVGPALGDDHRDVWSVVFRGTFQGSCGGARIPHTSPAPCPPPHTTVRVLLDAQTGAFVLAESPAGAGSVRITRDPGLLVLPPVDRTITDPATVSKLASDIEGLPAFPKGAINCPADFGTGYRLAFDMPGQSPWTAVIDVSGCRTVTPSDGPVRWGIGSRALFTDLGAALALAPGELTPFPCPAPSGSRCYPERAP